METLRLLTATAAITLPLLLLVVLQMSAKKGMTISFVIVLVLSYLVWGMDIITISASVLAGTIKALSIIWILIGAIFLLNILRVSGAIATIIATFRRLTGDKRLHTIIIGFFFIGLLEGASGFGAPAAIAGPLLVVLGFSPVAAASLSLLGNAVPMTFGAVGTPLIDGMGSALKTSEGLNVSVDQLIRDVAITASYVDLFIGSFVPVVQVLLLTTVFTPKDQRSLRYSLEILPFAFLSGLIYTSLAYLSTVTLGPEFGALLGALIGLVIIMVLIKYRFLLPKENIVVIDQETRTLSDNIKAWVPYVLIVLFLVLTRIIAPLKNFLLHLSISWKHILGTDINSKFKLFYSPGFVLLFTALLMILLFKLRKKEVMAAFKQTMSSAKKTTFALVPALAMVYIFLNSHFNGMNLDGMPLYLANRLSQTFGGYWIYIAPYIGNLGTFIAGSSTTSNIMFSQVQYQVAVQNNMDTLKVLTAQAIGANTGCMISVSKVVSACAVVGLTGKESKVLRVTIGISLIYALLIGIIVSILL